MAILAWKFPRTRLPVGASALCVVVLCWLYVFPVYRLPNEKEIIQGVLAQRTAWRRNQTAARVFSGVSYCQLFLGSFPGSGSSGVDLVFRPTESNACISSMKPTENLVTNRETH
ncbi:Alpha-N-acetylneuraminide alpha-2,8-sialyltransferase [Microtus ochrogaster]|uniref:Alpha-N-acetylneuraminide alpha-2,8-sialyltransferase n=1 Tax=Microtus ochrogaster TaxID=79684 RepID=A0A8J6L1C8_MICOH|nr:Alpha-N-acetylneuraminide alpha-2,8-sialyltransferase [Microtus ochrogaster]